MEEEEKNIKDFMLMSSKLSINFTQEESRYHPKTTCGLIFVDQTEPSKESSLQGVGNVKRRGENQTSRWSSYKAGSRISGANYDLRLNQGTFEHHVNRMYLI